ncbi:hypothetical protein RR42_m2106 [Cupriavidus basilensis]|uniref:Uncharacterized protein n=1 Tax=Cupriavidus basilensis TaxID=68895 RepID=A0A0C4Y977_9BURK|nr:hypothetical protein RR42_m2106 [Cupriavidus basilensis]
MRILKVVGAQHLCSGGAATGVVLCGRRASLKSHLGLLLIDHLS